HRTQRLPRLQRLWDYYRNPALTADDRPDLAQTRGLPARLHRSADALASREIVIENDIAWRLHAMVDFMLGGGVVLQSTAPDPARAAAVQSLLRRVIDQAGGDRFYHDLALLGAVYGYVDVLVR